MRLCFFLEPLEPRITLSAGFIATDFIPSGATTLDLGRRPEFPSFALQPNGRILVADDEYVQGCTDCGFIRRFNRDGKRDLTFGDNGEARLPFNTHIDDLLSRPDGRFIAFSWAGIYQFDPNGHLDQTFTNAYADADYNVGYTAVGPDGKLILAGQDWSHSIELPSGEIASHFALVSLNPDGTRDRSFAGRGILPRQSADSFGWAGYVTVQPDGKILVDATDYLDDIDVPLKPGTLLRFSPDGTPDQTFASNGRFHLASGEYCGPILLQPDGKIIQVLNSSTDLNLLRLNSDGSLDTTFGVHGRSRYTFADFDPTDYPAWEFAFLQPDGKIVVAGGSRVIRFDSDGKVDRSFGFNGAIDIASPDDRFHFWIDSAALAPDGHLLLFLDKSNCTPGGPCETFSAHILDIATTDAADSLMATADGNFILIAAEVDVAHSDAPSSSPKPAADSHESIVPIDPAPTDTENDDSNMSQDSPWDDSHDSLDWHDPDGEAWDQ